MINKRNNFIHNTGLSRDNLLVHFIDSLNENVDEEISVIEHSKYYEDHEFIEITSATPRKLSIINLNCQSLSAKFDELQVVISNACSNSTIDVITLQETWFDDKPNLSLYHLEEFDLINIPRRLSKHGGLIVYVKNTFSYSLCYLIPESDVFEGVFITIQSKQNPSVKYIIGDIYRPPHDKVSEREEFIDEFSLITQKFEELNYRAYMYLCGDYKY